MTDQITRLLDDIDRLDQQATKGPWIIDSIESGEHALFVDEDNPGYGHLGAASSTVASFLLEENANFIALSREAMPKLAEAVYHVLDLLDVVEKSNKYAYEFGGNKAPSLVTTNEVRKAITDTLGADDD